MTAVADIDARAMTTLDHACWYASQQRYVLPVWHTVNGVCQCPDSPTCGKNSGKHPVSRLVPKGQDNATTDLPTINRWFRGKSYNIGIACGPSRLIALDVDSPRPTNQHTDGNVELATLIDEIGPLPDTVTANTGSGATHLLYNDPGVEIVGRIGRAIDIKHNGYIVVAPSVHVSGGVYHWRAGRAPWEIAVADLPPEWVEHLRKPEPPTAKPVSRGPAVGDDFYTALESLDQRYVLQCISGSGLVGSERFAFKASRKGSGKYNLLVDHGNGWERTFNFIDSSGRIAARPTAPGADDGGPIASTWLRYYKHDDKAIRRGLIELVPELARFGEPRPKQRSPSDPIPSAEHPNAPHVNGYAASGDEIEERIEGRKRPTDPPPADIPADIGDPAGPTDVPPAEDPDDAAGDENPNAPWKGGKGPAAMAFDFVSKYARHPDGPMLRKWKGDFYGWTDDTGCYGQRTDDQIGSQLYRKLRLSEPKDVDHTRNALIAVDDVLIDHVELGNWIGEPTVAHPALELAPCRNGLLHLPTRTLYPSTPRFFTTAPLGTKFDPRAPWPKLWLQFLKQLWPKDDESIAALQEWFGYLLTPDTRQQKILLVVGPKRSGKGTIARVLHALIGGKESVAAPTLSSLGTNFGLQPLIGKSAAIIGDARLGGRTDIAAVVERLLTLSGGDALTIDRKHREPWTGYLSTRFTIISNELPKFSDASDALPARMVILELTESFYGKENIDLTDELIGSHKFPGELPGILRWAIEGWNHLRDRGRFVQPASSADLVAELEDLASPVKAWVRERCERGPDHVHDCTEAFNDFKRWCQEENQKYVMTTKRFGTDLRAAAQVTRKQVTGGDWVYRGISVKPEPEHWRKPRQGDVPPPGDKDGPPRADIHG